MNSKIIRKQFINYFETTLGHTYVPSAPVFPRNDPTLLFTNAGMNQFKPIFLGEVDAPYSRAVNSQKCIRVSGKHNDLEEVGRDHYHHTFFEMLGSWSFGDYYKAEAIEWAWLLFTDVWGINPDRLYATVYKDDNEAYELWKKISSLPCERILRCGEKDNFWSMGDTGPCGPCSEIHYYRGNDPKNQDPSRVNADDPDYIELWNLVFMEYNRDAAGKLTPLKKKHIDTGAGFERIVATLTGADSNYDTDLFFPIIDHISKLSKAKYFYDKAGIPHRVIADHVRMLTFSIADGAVPGNEGRSYVLRRILRRAARFGRKLGLTDPFIYKLVPDVVAILGETYPEIRKQKDHIQKIILSEEESFGKTLDKGLEIFETMAAETLAKKMSAMDPADVFKLYDTYGFPVDLTRLLAEEKGLSVNEAGFNKLMRQQKERARAAGKFQRSEKDVLNWHKVKPGSESRFIGYDHLESDSLLLKYAHTENGSYLIADRTPFYPESGGQIGDTGFITINGNKYGIADTFRDGKYIVHRTEKRIPESEINAHVHFAVTAGSRLDTARNHTATHLLHAALKSVLGDHVKQAGSYVGPDRLRFDFAHFKKLTDSELRIVENKVNEEILKNEPVNTDLSSYDEAVKKGAVALFGEKYGKKVRVVSVGGFSCELCGGTHVERSGDIGRFMIVNESAVASGVRRIEAITGRHAFSQITKEHEVVSEISYQLRSETDQLVKVIVAMRDRIKILEKDLKDLKAENLASDSDVYMENPEKFSDGSLYVNRIDVENMDQLKGLGDKIREKMKAGIAVFGTVIKGTPQILCVVSDDLVKKGYKAGNIVREMGKALGGGGGGRPHMATAGGRHVEKLDEVLAKTSVISKIK